MTLHLPPKMLSPVVWWRICWFIIYKILKTRYTRDGIDSLRRWHHDFVGTCYLFTRIDIRLFWNEGFFLSIGYPISNDYKQEIVIPTQSNWLTKGPGVSPLQRSFSFPLFRLTLHHPLTCFFCPVTTFVSICTPSALIFFYSFFLFIFSINFPNILSTFYIFF